VIGSHPKARTAPPPRPRRRSLLAGAAAAAVLLAATGVALWHWDRSNRRLTWSDEFDGAAGPPDPARWRLVDGHLGYNNELEYYRPENAVLDGLGSLVITARGDNAGQFDCKPRTCAATSARLYTEGLFTQKHGRFEARIKLPRGQGLWPAFWARRTDPDAGRGEIDVMEMIGQDPNAVHGSLHGGGFDTTDTFRLPKGQDFSDAFHVFAADWRPDQISFSVDGKVYATRRKKAAPPGGWDFDRPFFLLLNLAVGGDWAEAPDASTLFPQQMSIDYVRVFSDA
jgi:beta-glucanase (GH16 family)